MRSGSISLSQSISSSFSFRRMSFSVSGGGGGDKARESMSCAGDQGPLGNILLTGATLEHVNGSKDFIVRTSESSYPLRAQSGAEAGDWAAAIRANVLAASRSSSLSTRSQHGGGGGGYPGDDKGTGDTTVASEEFAEVYIYIYIYWVCVCFCFFDEIKGAMERYERIKVIDIIHDLFSSYNNYQYI